MGLVAAYSVCRFSSKASIIFWTYKACCLARALTSPLLPRWHDVQGMVAPQAYLFEHESSGSAGFSGMLRKKPSLDEVVMVLVRVAGQGSLQQPEIGDMAWSVLNNSSLARNSSPLAELIFWEIAYRVNPNACRTHPSVSRCFKWRTFEIFV